MTAAWRWLGAAGLALLAGAAAAQTRIELAPPAALDCLQVPTGEPVEPVYPFDQYKGGATGRVKAAVTLPGGLFGNDIDVLESEGDGNFVAASRRFLRSLAAPCLQPGEKLRLVYEFVFQPDQRKVVWAAPRANEDPVRREMAKCVRHSEGEKSPQYPISARRIGQQGRLFAVMTFKAPDAAPEVELVHRPAAADFAQEVRTWTAKLRMPCHSGEPVRTSAVFIFRLEGETAFGFKPLTLPELLGVSKGIRERRLELDTTTMGCPFSLKLNYYQPLRRNTVGEVGESAPQRRPLLELLAGLELELPRNGLDSVFADTADIAVPCIRLNLNDPKEKTS